MKWQSASAAKETSKHIRGSWKSASVYATVNVRMMQLMPDLNKRSLQPKSAKELNKSALLRRNASEKKKSRSV